MGDEEIVLLDEAGAAVGTAPKASSHHRATPYHLAFSCYLVDDAGRVLITQRAHDKPTWPSVWTNSCCGHPAPGETLRGAVLRRLGDELGVRAGAGGFTLLLPEFSYRAEMDNGVTEFERCPVVRVRVAPPEAGTVRPNPVEVAAAEWRTWDECLELAGRPEASPWYRLQVEQLDPLGIPADWPAAPTSLLPPALSW
ncbi:isopentenyl-diphosphate Delta-isomerase [Actinomadura alba]|uniref:Isopentenyl-diphosphate Delta-isomerase n=1 Tax=Actinomadura alba TaxID=406431 RepID=A0ABR7LYY8_9ACTN|nr:isopentenyl-diphosphate Delta-isomerase [Actinomadura alba]MBC6469976.1 isopentenyl-diphosphate Delta-isomerase [Actinomadura alba]